MSASNQSSSSASTDPGDQLHPSLLGIAAAMEQSESERKQRMSLAQGFLQNIDAWAKSQTGTEVAALVAPFIKEISPIVTAFAIGNISPISPPCKIPIPNASQITTSAPRMTKMTETPHHVLPKRPQVIESAWATVARKAAMLPDPPATLAKRRPATATLTNSAGREPLKEDKRLFLRMGRDNEWRMLSPVTIKKLVTERAGVAPSAIIAMTQVRSGLAIECASDALREAILRVGSSFQKENIIIEPASDWTSVIVPHVPIYIRTMGGRIEVTREMIMAECQAVCGVTPIQVRPNYVKTGQYSTSWIIHFKQVPANLKFRLFDESGPSIRFSRRRPIEQCQRCWGYHSTRTCVKGLRCESCSGTHEKMECTANIPKCANCAGPHESSHHDCMARPTRLHGQVTPRTPAELRIIRLRGQRDFNAAVLQSEVKEKGKAPEITNISVEKGKAPEVINILEEKGKAPEAISIPEEEMHDNE